MRKLFFLKLSYMEGGRVCTYKSNKGKYFYLFYPFYNFHMLAIFLKCNPGLELMIQLQELTKRERKGVAQDQDQREKTVSYFSPYVDRIQKNRINCSKLELWTASTNTFSQNFDDFTNYQQSFIWTITLV